MFHYQDSLLPELLPINTVNLGASIMLLVIISHKKMISCSINQLLISPHSNLLRHPGMINYAMASCTPQKQICEIPADMWLDIWIWLTLLPDVCTPWMTIMTWLEFYPLKIFVRCCRLATLRNLWCDFEQLALDEHVFVMFNHDMLNKIVM